MTSTKAFAVLGALATIAAAACSADSSSPSAPLAATTASAPRAELVSAPGALADRGGDPAPVATANSVLRTVALANDVSVTQSIGPDGGFLEIPEAGLRVWVPRGALRKQTAITATALKGDMVAYEFGPHGTRFALPLIVTQATAQTNLAALPTGSILQLGYFTSPDMLDRNAKQARVAEIIPTYGLVLNDRAAFLVWHFSGYMVGWSRQGQGQGQNEQR